MQTVADIVDALGGPTEFGKICGFERNPSARGSDIRQRGSINVRHWRAVIDAARAKGLTVDEDGKPIDEAFLTRLHEDRTLGASS